jgi:PhzF family phenazine biosynthesis protein
MKISLYRCFCTDAPNSGNIAGVVDATEITVQTLNIMAQQLKLPVLTAVYRDKQQLRFFYPQAEMPSCVHGTLAAVAWLQAQGKIVLKTSHQSIHAEKQDNRVQITTALLMHSKESLQKEMLLKLLGTHEDILHAGYYCGVASVGSPKLFISVKSLENLRILQPNLSAITTYSQQNKVNGIYVYTPETFSSQAHFHARAFNPTTGNSEDAATGVAAAALAGVLKRSIFIEQGNFMESPSLIQVTYHNDKNICVGGDVQFLEDCIV